MWFPVCRRSRIAPNFSSDRAVRQPSFIPTSMCGFSPGDEDTIMFLGSPGIDAAHFLSTKVRWMRHWAKKKSIKSTHYLFNEGDSALYRPVVPGTLLANARRLPNRKTRPREYRLAATSSGKFAQVQPYPPNVNATLAPYPKNVSGNQNDPNKLGHFKFTQKYRGIEYVSLKRMVPYPRGTSAYTFDIDRVFSHRKPRSTIALKLAQNLKLLKKVDTLSKIHSRTKNLTFSVCNVTNQFVKYDEHRRPCRPPLDRQGVQNLCSTSLDVMYNKTSFNVLQAQTNSLIGNAANFKIDELLLLLCPYAMYVDSYSRWFKVNYADFNSALAVYNRHLVCNVSDMSIEQLYFMIVLFTKLSKRYAQYALTEYPLLSSLVSKLIFFAENVPKTSEPLSNYRELEKGRLSEIRTYSTTLQDVYNCYYPYFRMIYTGFDSFRKYTDYLTKSSLHLQSLILTQGYPEILSHFDDLCSSLSKLGALKFLKLSSVLRLVTLFERNRTLYPDRVSNLSDLVNKLAISLHSLTIHMYVAGEDSAFADSQFEDVVLKMFTQVLDSASIADISQCLESLERSGHLNEHILMLFVPYIVNDLGNAPLNDLIRLMIQLTNFKFFHWMLWITLSQGIQVQKLNQIRDLELLNDFYSCLTVQNKHLIESKNIAQVSALRFIHVTKVGEEVTPETFTPIYAILKGRFNLRDPDLQSLVNTYTKLLMDLDEYFNLDTVGALENSQLLETFLNTRTKFKSTQAEI